ncbi:MAG: MerR family transcriptional regulator [candidate division WOR-3 bacterium]
MTPKQNEQPVSEDRPQTKFYTVTQVCRQLGVQPHVLRYWEEEFEIRVKRNSAGRRVFSADQLERLQTIKHLLRRERLTVRGAKARLAKMDRNPDLRSTDLRSLLPWLKKELISIRALLSSK